MTVLTIRACNRYPVRHPIWLRRIDGLEVSGLLIELSTEGCRISNLGCTGFSTGDAVEVQLERVRLSGLIRWAREGIVGVRLDTPLMMKELSQLIPQTRMSQQAIRYGT